MFGRKRRDLENEIGRLAVDCARLPMYKWQRWKSEWQYYKTVSKYREKLFEWYGRGIYDKYDI